MSGQGQTRKLAPVTRMSAPPLIADIVRLHAQVRLVPEAEVISLQRARYRPRWLARHARAIELLGLRPVRRSKGILYSR
jgi:hypothetical protein